MGWSRIQVGEVPLAALNRRDEPFDQHSWNKQQLRMLIWKHQQIHVALEYQYAEGSGRHLLLLDFLGQDHPIRFEKIATRGFEQKRCF